MSVAIDPREAEAQRVNLLCHMNQLEIYSRCHLKDSIQSVNWVIEHVIEKYALRHEKTTVMRCANVLKDIRDRLDAELRDWEETYKLKYDGGKK